MRSQNVWLLHTKLYSAMTFPEYVLRIYFFAYILNFDWNEFKYINDE